MKFSSRLRGWLVAICLATCLTARGILFYSTNDPDHNTTEPTGALAGSGWQYQGYWGGFLGTPVASNLFIAARHTGGAPGDRFTYQGVGYFAMDYFDAPDTDLRIWRVCGTFPSFAPLYTNSNETGRTLMVFGRGTQRGAEVRGSLDNALKGWQWGAYDGRLRWGENVVSGLVTQTNAGSLLKIAFNANGGVNEAHLSSGDSGGAVFIKDGAVWKLAGINYAVDGLYNTNSASAGFQAAIFDEGGLYKGEEGNWSWVPDLPLDLPGAFYASRISANLTWINSIISTYGGVPPPPVLQTATDPAGPYADAPSAAIDETTKTITVARTVQTQFYRLRACGGPRLTGIRTQGETVVITYE